MWNAFDINILDLHGLDSLFDIECYDWYVSIFCVANNPNIFQGC